MEDLLRFGLGLTVRPSSTSGFGDLKPLAGDKTGTITKSKLFTYCVFALLASIRPSPEIFGA